MDRLAKDACEKSYAIVKFKNSLVDKKEISESVRKCWENALKIALVMLYPVCLQDDDTSTI